MHGAEKVKTMFLILILSTVTSAMPKKKIKNQHMINLKSLKFLIIRATASFLSHYTIL